MSARAIDIARFLIRLAHTEPEPEFVSHMRLQKLLYYVQGWSLATRSDPMFLSMIQAWVHGPVVYDVYKAFRAYDDQPIPDSESADTLPDDDRAFVTSIWAHYKAFSASELRRMTHSEMPWLAARGDLPPTERADAEISHQSMMDWFSKERRRIQPPDMSMETVRRAEADFREGRGRAYDLIQTESGYELSPSSVNGGRD
jgi:uncharacterized phage-associated protein